MLRYCEAEGLTFTRSRPYKKNDGCYVEQKNWHVVRRSVGYVRYDTDEEIALLNDLYDSLRLMTNFFSPQMKLVEKIREGARVRRHHDEAKTAYRRLLASGILSSESEQELTAFYLTLNPVAIQRKIGRIQQKLRTLAVDKLERQRKEAITDRDLEYLPAEATIPGLESIPT